MNSDYIVLTIWSFFAIVSLTWPRLVAFLMKKKIEKSKTIVKDLSVEGIKLLTLQELDKTRYRLDTILRTVKPNSDQFWEAMGCLKFLTAARRHIIDNDCPEHPNGTCKRRLHHKVTNWNPKMN